jgi:hypothetical protein
MLWCSRQVRLCVAARKGHPASNRTRHRGGAYTGFPSADVRRR